MASTANKPIRSRILFALRHWCPSADLVVQVEDYLRVHHPGAHLLLPRPFGALVRSVVMVLDDDRTAYIELDWGPDSQEADVRWMAQQRGLTLEVVTREGPGGGNPLYKFIGKRSAIWELLKAYDPDEAESLYEHVEYV